MAEKIRTAVVGAGKMGGIHTKVYSKLDNCELIGVVDPNLEAAEKIASEYGVKAYASAEELIGLVDAVTISAPTVYHHELAKLFIENGVAVMIEKPLAASVEEGRDIVDLAKKHDVVVAVGHSERCNPVSQAMKRLDIEPKFIEANRISPYPFRSTDIGVVLDVMIHDIDIVLSLAGSKIKKVDAVGVNVIGDHEDICNARVFFENGCVANITAYDFDFSTVNWPDLLNIEQLDIDDREPLRVEQESFLEAVEKHDARPEVTGEEGLAALECADMILEAIKEHKWE